MVISLSEFLKLLERKKTFRFYLGGMKKPKHNNYFVGPQTNIQNNKTFYSGNKFTDFGGAPPPFYERIP